jgi:hypothetical protein
MSDYNDIRRALEKRLSSIVGLPSKVSYENVKFIPTENAAWMRCTLSPLSREAAAISGDAQKIHRGLFVVDVFVPINTAPKTVDEYVDLILASFENGLRLTENSKDIIIRNARRTQGVSENAWYYVPVIIDYYSYI